MMRGRFGRRRRREEGASASIDPSWLERVAASGPEPLNGLERLSWEDVPDSFALVGAGATADGRRVLVAVSPRSGGDALLAVLVAAARDASREAGVAAFSPSWDAASRRRLGWVTGMRAPIRAILLPHGAGVAEVGSEPQSPLLVSPAQVAAGVSSPGARTLLRRVARALAGLAAKHGGATRSAGGGLELVILARAVAALRAEGDRVVLETLLPGRSTAVLTEDSLADALDRLEGLVRKRLNERDVREGEEGMRGRLLGPLAGAAGLRDAVRWPGGQALQAIDLAAVAADGTPTLGAVRERISLPVLAGILDAAAALEPMLPVVLGEAGAPVLLGHRPRLALAFRQIDPACGEALSHLALEVSGFEIGEGDRLRPRELGAREAPLRAQPTPVAPPAAPQPTPTPLEPSAASEEEEESGEGREGAGRGRRRRRRGRRRAGPREGPSDEGTARAADNEEPEEAADEGPSERRFEEISLFDLDDEPAGGEGAPLRRRRRRGRGRGRTRRGDAAEGEGEDEEGDGAGGAEVSEVEERIAAKGRGGRKGGSGRRQQEAPAAVDEVDDDDEILALSPDAPDVEDLEVPAYEDEDGEEPESELDRVRLERERRRRARNASLDIGPPAEEAGAEASRDIPADEVVLPRGRAAILVHTDRDAIAAAVLLARDLRQVEGIWIYPQDELMTFFRGVAVDLREGAPIYVVGFTAKSARDAIQAASLYSGRLVWFDHHAWAPEDLGTLREALGPGLARISPKSGSALASVLSVCSRRSRFSDKLVDLVTGRFTAHDFERWGRLWWWRLGELAKRPGEHRADLEALLTGRPSDLAREAREVAPPPPPEELAWVAGRDFRIVHFGGIGLVVLEVPAHLDIHLASRIARERYGVALSLSRTEDGDLLVLGADDASGRRSIDVGGMVDHLAEKFEWCEAMGDEDHVARLRAEGLASRPERFDELIAEIGMGRSILEG